MLKSIPYFDDLMTLLQVFTVVYIFARRTKEDGIPLLNPVEVCIVLFYLSFLYPTITISKDYKSWVTYAAQGIGSVMLGCQLIQTGPERGLKILRNILMVFLAINLLTMLQGINAARSDYFLGARIAFTPYIMLAVFSTVTYDLIVTGKVLSNYTVLMYILALLNAFIVEVSTAEIILIVMIPTLWFVAVGKINSRVVLNYWVMLAIYVTIFIVIVILSGTDFLSGILEAFGEDTTFNGRTTIWRTALTYIVEKPFFGHGTTALGDFLITEYVNQRTLPAHNEILNILYQGGAFSLFFFALIYIVTGAAANRCRDNKRYLLVTVIQFFFFLLTITEVQTQKAIIFIVTGMAYQLLRYEPEDDDEDEEEETQEAYEWTYQ